MKLLLFLVLSLATIQTVVFHAASAENAQTQERSAEQIRFSAHALKRMAERGVSREQVLRLVESLKPFRYFHQHQWKLGYFDPSTGLFVATVGGVVITVFTDATPGYIERLKRAKP